MERWLRCLALMLSVSLAWNELARAQVCEGKWLPGQGIPGVSGQVRAVVALPNGDIAVGGTFQLAGGAKVQNIALYRPATSQWSALGRGLDDSVLALAVLNGQLVAGGFFRHSGDTETPYIARWTGAEWLPLATGFDQGVRALAILPNGSLLAAGDFMHTSGGGTLLVHVARWNGSSWFSLGTQVAGLTASVESLLALPNGDVIAGGTFVSSFFGTTTWNHVARWNGSVWSALGSGIGPNASSTSVSTLARMPNGDIAAGGYFSSAGAVTASYVALWNGSSWSSLGAGFDAPVNGLFVRANGTLIAAGGFGVASGNSAYGVAQWNGAAWPPFAPTSPITQGIALAGAPSGELVAIGFSPSGASLARYSDATHAWSTGTLLGFSSDIRALVQLANGDVIAGGGFATVNGVTVNGVARWDGASWFALGSGVDGLVESLAVLPSGPVIAGGTFTSAGGVPAANVAAWNGSAWTALGSGVDGPVQAVLARANGEVVVGGSFAHAGGLANANIARWSGSSWLVDFAGGTNARVIGLTPDGTAGVIASGLFTSAGGTATAGLAAWSFNPGSTQWFSLASSADGVVTHALQLANGDLIAGGTFFVIGGTNARNIARLPFFGAIWVPLGPGLGGLLAPDQVTTLVVRPNGDLVVAGGFSGAAGVGANGVALWTGSVWKRLSTGLSNPVYAVLPQANNDLLVGGAFLSAGFETSAHFARFANAAGSDSDGDGSKDMCDNCAFVANASQLDTGGIGIAGEDGIGDACQCADVTGDGSVLTDDLDAIRSGLVGLPFGVTHPDHCSVSGPVDPGILASGMRRDCDEADAARIRRALRGYAPALGQTCDAATP